MGAPAVMRRFGALGLLLQLGWTMVVTLVVSLLAGVWLDQALGTQPWLTLLGVLLGIAAGTYGVYRIVSTALEQQQSFERDLDNHE